VGQLTQEGRAAIAAKLNLPEDASDTQLLEATDYLVARANARTKGTVSKDPIRASLGISDTDPVQVVGAGVSTQLLNRAKELGLSASTPPKEILVGVRAANRIFASQQEARQNAVTARRPVTGKPAKGSAAGSPPGRVAASTAVDPRGVYASNPLVAQLQQTGDYPYAVQASGGQVPTLFASGDTPAFTSSGIDPKILKGVPWQARHSLAAEPSRVKALEMYEELSGPDGEVLAAQYAHHDGVKAYEQRVMAWANAGWDARQAADVEQRKVAAAAAAVQVEKAVGPQEEWTDDQCYEHLFGDLDRRDAERALSNQKAILDGRAVGHGYDLSEVRAAATNKIDELFAPTRDGK
jgi:hypothetical protein